MKLAPGQLRILEDITKHPHTTATEVHRRVGLAEAYTRRAIHKLIWHGLVHVSGYDEFYKRRKPQLYAPGPAEGPKPQYPYVPEERQKENLRLYQRNYQRRKSTENATRESGAMGFMVAQMRARSNLD